MALWPNARYMTLVAGRHFGAAPGLDPRMRGQRGDRMNRFIGETFTKTASTPDGYGMRTPNPPIKAGSMSGTARSSLSGDAYLLSGGPMEGSASISISGDASLSMIVGLEGNAVVVSLAGDGCSLKLTMGLNGSGSMSISGSSGLSMIVPFEGSGSVVQFSGVSDLRGILSLHGEWTPFTELSPENLARAVWSALLTQYQEDGTAGKALSLASSGGVDLNALAQAVLAAARVTPIHSNVKQMNDEEIIGDGAETNKFRSHKVP